MIRILRQLLFDQANGQFGIIEVPGLTNINKLSQSSLYGFDIFG